MTPIKNLLLVIAVPAVRIVTDCQSPLHQKDKEQGVVNAPTSHFLRYSHGPESSFLLDLLFVCFFSYLVTHQLSHTRSIPYNGFEFGFKTPVDQSGTPKDHLPSS
ncbi:hypothetical protein EDB92DRAFT_1896980 [Lactarius akahatsu]|uniref:Uncharacterized protein n=1 Tax=Lactarius akahatsu TaxID=416441 RepID=A0AAD4L8I1_9AGAM|nr:hypothetical protein EDB92DRAFT_1896980 [Lactarius akahatsu]